MAFRPLQQNTPSAPATTGPLTSALQASGHKDQIDSFFRPLSTPTETPTQTPTPEAQPQFGDGINKVAENVLGVPSRLVTGAAKGAASTVATVASGVGGVTAAASDLVTQNKYNQALQTEVEAKNKAIEGMKKLPEDSPRRKIYQKIIDDINRSIDTINSESATARDQADTFADKPDFVKPQGTAEKVGFGAEKIAEFIAGSKGLAAKPTTANEIVQTVSQGARTAATTGEKLLNVGAQAASEGVASGVVTAAQGGNVKDTLKATLLSTLLSVPFKAFNEFKQGAGEIIKESAQKKATQALNPTTKENKQIAEKIVPEMLDRKVRFITRAGLENTASENADNVGEKINEAWKALPPDTKSTISPFMDDINKLKDDLTVSLPDGTRQVPEAAAAKYQALQNVQNEILGYAKSSDETLPGIAKAIDSHVASAKMVLENTTPEDLQAAGGIQKLIERVKTNVIEGIQNDSSLGDKYAKYVDKIKNVDISKATSVDEAKNLLLEAANDSASTDSVSSESIRQWKQIQDSITKIKGKTFGLSGAETDKLYAQKAGANAIRNILNTDNPEIAKLNKEFTFWKNVEKVVGDTVQRTKGQSSLSENIAEGVGAVTGATVKGTFGGAVLTATGLRLIKRAVTSPAWLETSAILRNQIAEGLINGNSTEVVNILNRIVTGAVSTPKQQKQTKGEQIQ